MSERPVLRKGAGASLQTGERARAAPLPVAVVIGQLGQGGSERQLYLFLARCDRSAWAPVLYVSGELGFWEEPIRALGVPIVLLTGNPLAKLLHFCWIVRRQRPIAFFSWSSYTNVFAVCLLGMTARRIGSFRNSLFSDLPERARAVWAWASAAALSVAVCNSYETFAALSARSGLACKAVYVPNGVEPIQPDQIQAWRREWRARLRLATDDILIVGVGRLVPQKCFARFVDTVALVAQNMRVRAVIAGSDNGSLTALQERVAQLDLEKQIEFLGQVPDAQNLICAADLFLLTSDYEGMPNVVLEAMAVGVPCVTTRVNAVPALILHGETGFVGGFDAGELAVYVEKLARDVALRTRMGAAARAHIQQNYDADRLAEALWRLCDHGDDARGQSAWPNNGVAAET
ncbi:glycosyltransferase [Methylobacterium sp. CM6257]